MWLFKGCPGEGTLWPALGDLPSHRPGIGIGGLDQQLINLGHTETQQADMATTKLNWPWNIH